MDAEEITRTLGLRPHPEGGWFRRTYRTPRSSAIYYLLGPGERSVLHLLDGDELYHHYAGAPLQLLLLHPDGGVSRPVLGPDLTDGQRPQLLVPAGVWQGSRALPSRGGGPGWSLVGTTMAPPFRYDGWRLGERAALTRGWPDAAADIAALT